MDWYSRYVLAWQLSNTLDGLFCQVALQQALVRGKPEIFNTDQGVQFTALAFTSILEGAGIRISMDGRGHALDNIFIERLWRTIKYEDIYPNRYASVPALFTGLVRAKAIGRRRRSTSPESLTGGTQPQWQAARGHSIEVG